MPQNESERIREILDGLNTFYVECARPYDPKDRGLEHPPGLKPSEAESAIAQILREARLEEYKQGLLTGAMPEFIGKPMAEEHLAALSNQKESGDE